MLEPKLCKKRSEHCYNLWFKNGTKNIQIKKSLSIEIIKVTIFPSHKKSPNISIIIFNDNDNNTKKPPE